MLPTFSGALLYMSVIFWTQQEQLKQCLCSASNDSSGIKVVFQTSSRSFSMLFSYSSTRSRGRCEEITAAGDQRNTFHNYLLVVSSLLTFPLGFEASDLIGGINQSYCVLINVLLP